MNIMSFSGPLHREFGGPPMAVTGSAASLSNLGHHIELYICGQSDADAKLNNTFFSKLKDSGVQVQVFARRNQSVYGTILRWSEIKLIWNRFSSTDFVILHQVFQLQFIALWPLLIIRGIPFAVMPHGSLTKYQRLQHRLRKIFSSLFIYLFLKSARGIFVASAVERDELPKYLQSKSEIVGLGIHLPSEKKSDLRISDTNFNLLFMGRIAKKKRLDVALQAFALAVDTTNRNMRFLICGTGDPEEVEKCMNLAIDLGISSIVEFRGWVDREEKIRALKESDCFILTSEDENFAIAAAEALSYGVPCILSAKVALASFVTKHSAGVIFEELAPPEIAKAIINVAKLNRKETQVAALHAASQLVWEVVSRQWETCIKSLLGR